MAESRRVPSEVKEIHVLQRSLLSSFEKERWDTLETALAKVALLGEKHAKRELSLLAQNLQQAIAIRAKTTETATYYEMSEHFDDLISQMSHLAWAKSS